MYHPEDISLLRAALDHVVTAYDISQSKRKSYNRYALAQYLEAVDGIVKRIADGQPVRQTIEDACYPPISDKLVRAALQWLDTEVSKQLSCN